MPSPGSTPIQRWTAVVILATLLAACSAKPVSQATSSQAAVAPATETPAAATTETPASPGDSVPSSPPSPTPAPATGVPPKPGNPTFERIGSQPMKGGGPKETYRITWTAPEGVATAFLVYGVTQCLRESRQFDGKPCVARGMKIPKKTLKVLAQAPGASRSIDITWTADEIGPGPYAAVLIRATNDAGDSIFTIVHSDDVCWRCTY